MKKTLSIVIVLTVLLTIGGVLFLPSSSITYFVDFNDDNYWEDSVVSDGFSFDSYNIHDVSVIDYSFLQNGNISLTFSVSIDWYDISTVATLATADEDYYYFYCYSWAYDQIESSAWTHTLYFHFEFPMVSPDLYLFLYAGIEGDSMDLCGPYQLTYDYPSLPLSASFDYQYSHNSLNIIISNLIDGYGYITLSTCKSNDSSLSEPLYLSSVTLLSHCSNGSYNINPLFEFSDFTTVLFDDIIEYDYLYCRLDFYDSESSYNLSSPIDSAFFVVSRTEAFPRLNYTFSSSISPGDLLHTNQYIWFLADRSHTGQLAISILVCILSTGMIALLFKKL